MRKRPVYRKKSAAPVKRELLKIDGLAVEVKAKLNPRARRLIVKVHPANGEVSVIAPSLRALDRAIEFARGESDWIARQLARVPQRIAFAAGARIPLRGREAVVLAEPGVRGPAGFDAAANAIRIGGRSEHTARRLLDFLKREARSDLETRTLDFAVRLGVRPRRIALRDTRSRWGSCSTTRSLSFSWRLIMAPPFVLDYVVAHEVAHLREMNHGAEFWRLVRTLVGDIEKPQAWLRQCGTALHRYGV
jgi:predicted metal-dependent hydrolase